MTTRRGHTHPKQREPGSLMLLLNGPRADQEPGGQHPQGENLPPHVRGTWYRGTGSDTAKGSRALHGRHRAAHQERGGRKRQDPPPRVASQDLRLHQRTVQMGQGQGEGCSRRTPQRLEAIKHIHDELTTNRQERTKRWTIRDDNRDDKNPVQFVESLRQDYGAPAIPVTEGNWMDARSLQRMTKKIAGKASGLDGCGGQDPHPVAAEVLGGARPALGGDQGLRQTPACLDAGPGSPHPEGGQ